MENRIREIRKQQGMSLEKLAELAGTTHQTIQRLETGERRLNEDWMEVISKALGVKPEDLISRGLSPVQRKLLQLTDGLPQEEQERLYQIAELTLRNKQ